MQQQLKFLTEAYDFQDVVAKELGPLVSRIHAICQEKRIPYVCAIGSMCDPEKNEHIVSASTLLVGPERTPPELALANLAVQKGIPDAMKFGTFCLISGFTAEQCPDEGEADFADGVQPTVGGHGHA